MAKPITLVDGVSGISAPSDHSEAGAREATRPILASVNFQRGRAGLLDMSLPQSAVWVEVLESLRETNQPAYVEIDPETNVITELLCPVMMGVVGIGKEGKKGDVEIKLAISHARHFLRRSNPDFKEMLETLRKALKQEVMVLVTESSDGDEIVNVELIEGADTGGLK